MTTSLEKRIVKSLNYQAAHMDNETIQRLQAIRRDALNRPSRSWFSFTLPNNWLPATGLIAGSIFAVLLFYPQSQSINNSTPLEQTAMVELLENAEDLDVISDVGFYLWMDELEAQNV